MFEVGRAKRSDSKIYTNPIKEAMRYKEYLDNGKAKSQADLARILGVSRAKVNQMLNLLKLYVEIREFILNLDEKDERLKVITERRLRQLTKIKNVEHQRDEFLKIVKD